ncbi:MAG: phospholipase D-like domain-containing protein [Candidatus Gastranaerophilales bacterium]
MKKKVVLLSSLIALTNFITPTNCAEISVPQAQETYKVLKVIDGDTMYIDFNRDGYYQKDEKVRLNGIDTFEVKPSYWLDNQMKQFNFTQTEALGLGYYGKEFANKNLLNKEVIVKFSTNPATEKETSISNNTIWSEATQKENPSQQNLETSSKSAVGKTGERERSTDATGTKTHDVFNRELVSIYFTDGRNYEQEVLKSGLATVYEKSNLAPQLKEYENLDKVYKNSEKARKLDLVLLNKKNGKYHKPTCKYGQIASNVELMPKPPVFSKYTASSCCYPCKGSNCKKSSTPQEQIFDTNQKPFEHSIEIVIPPSNQSDDNLKTGVTLLFNSPLDYNLYPSESTTTNSGRVLIDELNKLKKEEIYLATYGIAYQPELMNAFINAQKRKNTIYAVTDVDVNNKNIYRDTFYAMKAFGDWKTDYYVDRAIADKILKDKAEGKITSKGNYNGSIMHNKFVTLGKDKVWMGSTNMSSSGTGGLNCNLSALISSPEITHAYITEAKQLHSGKFHTTKTPYHMKDVQLDDGSKVSVYFCPNPDVINEIVTQIDSSTDYVYVAMFFLTNDKVIDSLVKAKQRGVDVRVITCASACNEKYSKHNNIRKKGIPLKVENWTGKMHMKTIIIDDRMLTVGSMNATRSAEKKNDENIVFIENPTHATTAKGIFQQLWDSIPEKWLTETPRAESPESSNSCNDGLDNDHNWKYDAQDSSCASFDYVNAPRYNQR